MNNSEVMQKYRERSEQFEKEMRNLESSLRSSSMYRFGVFIITLCAAYLTYSRAWAFGMILLLGSILFIFLILRHERLKWNRNLSKELMQINRTEIAVFERNYSGLPEGNEFRDTRNHFAHDVDLFGKGSLFQVLNRTGTSAGRSRLANWLKSNDELDIPEKQEMVRSLRGKLEWRQRFTAFARLIPDDQDPDEILDWVSRFSPMIPSHLRTLPYVYTTMSALLILSVSLGWIGYPVLLFVFFGGLGITLFYFKQINLIYQISGKAKGTFKQYQHLLNLIETESFDSVRLERFRSSMHSEDRSASDILNSFSKILDAFDQRNNLLFGIIGNGFLLWDLHQSLKIQHWVSKYKDQVQNWFEAVSVFDAANSLGNYAYNHQGHSYPKLIKGPLILDAEGMGHPLIDPKSRVANSLRIEQGDFIVITGANMAGKSTFLRTVSVAIIMANNGLPVCAGRFEYQPIKLITSMRTDDSLAEDSSYFYAEIMRLQFLMKELRKDRYFIILDEILKGTNSKDKALGSKKFIRKLADSGSTGLIATHDLSLCEIAEEYTQISNKHFNAEIKDGELYFDYLLSDGVCKNMNASFLLKKLGIV